GLAIERRSEKTKKSEEGGSKIDDRDWRTIGSGCHVLFALPSPSSSFPTSIINHRSSILDPRSSTFNLPRRSHLAAEPFVGFFILKALRFRIPLEFHAAAQGDHAQMADGDGAVSDFDIADRAFARAQTVEEIAHMVVGNLQPLRVAGERLIQQLLVTGRDHFVIHENPLAAFAAKKNAIFAEI